ncbi:MAG: YopX family protein [Blautia sp.]|uniref:YopX family protein n=1 Tax=Blautia sp. TaxID=1955243 RepID=UPI0025C4508A|nr:YopX family protein [Blautia sp.]MCI7449043.1 YopX family protein [Blautia sp.]
MREILFKAKRVDNGEWVVGQYVNTCYPGKDKETGHFIVVYPNEYHEIYTSTICQFTGLFDRYGNKIWENDILKTWSDEYAQVKFGLYSTGFASDDCNQGFYVEFPEDAIYRHELGYWCKESYVIGNIFDNKELLQEEHK